MDVKNKGLLVIGLLSKSDEYDTATLAYLVQASDEQLFLAAEKFPLVMKGGREVSIDGKPISAFLEIGVVERKAGGLQVMAEKVIGLLKEKGGSVSNTTTGSRNKKTSNTIFFVFESSQIHGKPFAFVPQIGARVRSGIVSQVAPLDHENAQMVVHEVSARVLSGSIKGDAVTYCRGIVAKAIRGQFVPAAGLELADELDAQIDAASEDRKQILRVVK